MFSPRVVFAGIPFGRVRRQLVALTVLVLMATACGSTAVVEPVVTDTGQTTSAEEESGLEAAAAERASEYLEPNVLDRAEVLEWYRDTEGLSPSEAQCMTDESLDILGSYNVALPKPEEIQVIDELRLVCVGQELTVESGQPPPGLDAALDALWVSCTDGDMPACDQLFDDSAAGSDYERYGATCGGRGLPDFLCDETAVNVDPVIRSAAIAGRMDAGMSEFEAECVTDGYVTIVGDPSPLPGSISTEQEAEIAEVETFCAEEASILEGTDAEIDDQGRSRPSIDATEDESG